MKLLSLAFAVLAAFLASPALLPTGPANAASSTAAATWTLGDLVISGAYARATLPHAPTGGGYITIANHGSSDDTLVSVTSPLAGMVQIHGMSMDGSVMKMTRLDAGVAIPAGKTVTFSPSGLHLMFMQLKGGFVEGKTVPATLTFAKAGSISIELPIAGIAAKSADPAPADAMSGMQM